MLRYKLADTQKNNYKFRKTSMTPIKPFYLDIPDETIAHIKSRVAEYPWHEMPDDGGWDYGVNMNYLKEFCAYWAKDYDWQKHQTAINRFSHFKAPVDGIDLHFIHEKGSGDNATPLIISHGWPGTIVEFLDFIDLLAHPENTEVISMTPLMSWPPPCRDLGFQDASHGPTAHGKWPVCSIR